MVGAEGNVLPEVRLNALGLRGPWYPMEKKPGILRIACLGDSFTFGWPVEDGGTYPVYLAQKLEEVLGFGRAEVVNFGHPGYNTQNELRQYVKLVRPWKPDIVLLGYFFNDTQPEDFGLLYTDCFFFKLLGRTAILEAFHRHIRPKIFFLRRKDPPELKALKKHFFEHSEIIMSDPDADVSKPYWNRSMKALAELAQEVRADDARFLLLSFPKRSQVLKLQMARQKGLITLGNGKETDRIQVARRKNPARIEQELEKELRPQAALRAHVQKLEVPFLDLLLPFIARDEYLFHAEDPGHLNSLGYQITAEKVALFLKESGWLDASSGRSD